MSGIEIFGHYYPPIVIRDIFNLVYLIFAIVSFFVLGGLLHELTHWFVAWLVGAWDIQVDVRVFGGGSVQYKLPGGAAGWRFWAIQVSPQLIGILLVLPYLAWLILEGTSPLLWYVVGTFFVSYSVLGGAADLIPAASRGDGHVWHPSERDQLYLISFGMVVGGVILGSIDASGAGFRNYAVWAGRWLMAGGGVIVLWDLWRRESASDT